ncbi:MAG TPA: phosphoribosyltransferase family protein [Trueperaceae bacterium]|nr:phosphoribosyltransferase family protein [Trueperaceae bacterium]
MTLELLRGVRNAAGALRRCPVCLSSSAGASGVCAGCERRLVAAVAALPPPSGPTFWLGAYAGPWLRLIHALKYGGDRRLARLLGRLLAQRATTAARMPRVVTFVPASPARLAERGFDQAELLAAAVADAAKVDLLKLLRRSTTSLSQARLSRAERALNAGASFVATACNGRYVLLVDDVLTTGATTTACAAALLAAGASEVRTAVVARTARR